jgi:YegS C-terminal NAD kinase beta sandwich-like domain
VSIAKGQPWGRPSPGPADLEGHGDDAALARIVEHLGPGRLVRFTPTDGCLLARTLGLPTGAGGRSGARARTDAGAPSGIRADPSTALPVDVLRVAAGEQFGQRLAMNSVVLGVAPDALRRRHRAVPVSVVVDGRTLPRTAATTVAIMNGQFLGVLGAVDLAPRGHPGDGRAEIVVIDVPPDQRREMRARLASGTHVPHPGITIVSGGTARIRFDRPVALTVDGHAIGSRSDVTVEVLPSHVSLWV